MRFGVKIRSVKPKLKKKPKPRHVVYHWMTKKKKASVFIAVNSPFTVGFLHKRTKFTSVASRAGLERELERSAAYFSQPLRVRNTEVVCYERSIRGFSLKR